MNKKFFLALFVALAAFFIGIFMSTGNFVPTCVFCTSTKEQSSLAMKSITVRDISGKLYHITGEYPQFSAASSEFNDSIRNFIDARIREFKQNSADNWRARQDTLPPGEEKAEFPPTPFYLAITWTPAELDPGVISFVLHTESYEGGANARYELKTFNYSPAQNRTLTLQDLFPGDSDYLKKISDYSRTSLASQLNMLMEGTAPTEMIREGTEPNEKNFENFTFDDNRIIIYFQKYQVAPGAAGEQSVIIQRSQKL